LTWGTSSGPDTLLDLTTPTLPTIITSGIYAFTLALRASGVTLGGYFLVDVELDVAGEDYGYEIASNVATAADTSTALASAVMYLAATMQVKVAVTNRDGASARDFTLFSLVQRVG
jgi:hypothetical protein